MPGEKVGLLRTGSIAGGGGFVGSIYFITLGSPYSISAAMPSPCDAMAQDYIAVTENHAITIGGVVGDIDLLQISPFSRVTVPSVPAVDVVESSHPFTDHPLGIVKINGSSVGGIYIYDLETQSTTPIRNASVPNCSTTTTSYVAGNARLMSDSIQATATRVIAIENRIGSPDGFVGICDLLSAPPHPQLPWEVTRGFSCPPNQPCSGSHPDESLHDVTVSPDGRYGIVSGNGVVGVFRMRDGVQTLKEVEHVKLPHMRFVTAPYNFATVDSVEASNTRAVVIGKNGSNNSMEDPIAVPLVNNQWRIAIVDLPASTFDAPTSSSFTDPSSLESRAHDVAITPLGAKAVVSTRQGAVVFDLTPALPNIVPVPYATGTDPLGYVSGTGNGAFASDSVAVTNDQAVLIGRWGAPSVLARIAIIDLLAPPGPAAITQITFPDVIGPNARFWLPTDVAIGGSDQFAVVRMVDLSNVTSNQRGRLVVIDLATNLTVLDQTNALSNPLGMAQGFDQVECSLTKAITAGEYFVSQSPPVDAWCQIVEFP